MENSNPTLFLHDVLITERHLSISSVEKEITTFRHVLQLGVFADLTHKNIVTHLQVSIHDGEEEASLGYLGVHFIYKSPLFDAIFTDKELKNEAAEVLLKLAANESVSTLRGIMIEHFKGTILQKAYLPIGKIEGDIIRLPDRKLPN
jgi:hypothetical protein